MQFDPPNASPDRHARLVLTRKVALYPHAQYKRLDICQAYREYVNKDRNRLDSALREVIDAFRDCEALGGEHQEYYDLLAEREHVVEYHKTLITHLDFLLTQFNQEIARITSDRDAWVGLARQAHQRVKHLPEGQIHDAFAVEMQQTAGHLIDRLYEPNTTAGESARILLAQKMPYPIWFPQERYPEEDPLAVHDSPTSSPSLAWISGLFHFIYAYLKTVVPLGLWVFVLPWIYKVACMVRAWSPPRISRPHPNPVDIPKEADGNTATGLKWQLPTRPAPSHYVPNKYQSHETSEQWVPTDPTQAATSVSSPTPRHQQSRSFDPQPGTTGTTHEVSPSLTPDVVPIRQSATKLDHSQAAAKPDFILPTTKIDPQSPTTNPYLFQTAPKSGSSQFGLSQRFAKIDSTSLATKADSTSPAVKPYLSQTIRKPGFLGSGSPQRTTMFDSTSPTTNLDSTPPVKPYIPRTFRKPGLLGFGSPQRTTKIDSTSPTTKLDSAPSATKAYFYQPAVKLDSVPPATMPDSHQPAAKLEFGQLTSFTTPATEEETADQLAAAQTSMLTHDGSSDSLKFLDGYESLMAAFGPPLASSSIDKVDQQVPRSSPKKPSAIPVPIADKIVQRPHTSSRPPVQSAWGPASSRPVTPAPASSRPVTPAPASSRPVTPAPTSSRPVTPAPTSSRPVTPAPASSRPVTPAPTSDRPVPPLPTGNRLVPPPPTSDRPFAPAPASNRPSASARASNRPVAAAPARNRPAAATSRSGNSAAPAPGTGARNEPKVGQAPKKRMRF